MKNGLNRKLTYRKISHIPKIESKKTTLNWPKNQYSNLNKGIQNLKKFKK
jgi:hypothetical protein